MAIVQHAEVYLSFTVILLNYVKYKKFSSANNFFLLFISAVLTTFFKTHKKKPKQVVSRQYF